MFLANTLFQDITNTVTLCVLLRMRVKGFGAETDGIVKAVMVLAVETASYTSVFALIGGDSCPSLLRAGRPADALAAPSRPLRQFPPEHRPHRRLPRRLLE